MSDDVSAACVDILKSNFEVDFRTNLSPDQLSDIAGKYDAWVVRSATKITAKLIEKADRLKIIGRAGAGVDNIDVDAATQRGIIVMNTPGGNTVSTAEHTVAMILALARSVPQADRSVRAGEWKKNKYTGTELFEKRLGIIGIGKVGREVATRMKSFNMEVVAFDPVYSQQEAIKIGVQLVSLEELLQTSDFISVHTPLNKATENLLNKDSIGLCKKGVRLINCARGGIIHEPSLAEAIRSGHVAGAALDVFTQEPPGEHELLSLPQVIATPHLGASTEEAQEKVAIQIAEQILDAFNGRTIRGAVNMMPLSSEILSRSESLLTLSSRLGFVSGELLKDSIQSVRLTYFGDILDHPTELLTRAYLGGLFGRMMENVNIINAPGIATKHGVAVTEVRSTEHQDFSQLISAQVKSSNGEVTLAGTLYGKRDPRLVGIDDYAFDSQLHGMLLKFSNDDKPGMIGRLGSILGTHGINIAQMALGRRGPGGKAMTILNVDQEVKLDVQEELSDNGFTDVCFIDLNKIPFPHELRLHQE